MTDRAPYEEFENELDIRRENMHHWIGICIAVVLISALSPVGFADSDEQNNRALASSWAAAHGGPSKQAASKEPAPAGAGGSARLAPYRDGVSGVSPWLIQTDSNRLYGASLGHFFRFRTAGRVEFESGFELTRVGSISWNLFGLSSDNGLDRIVVPQPLGLRNPKQRGHRCAGRIPALLVFEDRPDRPVDCSKKFEFKEAELARLCNAPSGSRMGYSGVITGVLFSGEIAATIAFKSRGVTRSYMVIVDNALSAPLACAELGQSASTNQFPVERLSDNRSAMYVATDEALVRLEYNPASRRLVKRWSVDLGMPQRTGTTPTLIGFGEHQFVVLVDGICAVSNVFTGRIECSDRQHSRMVYVRRGEAKPVVGSVNLPAGIRTVENSPAATGLQIVIANYAGYRLDAKTRGVVSLAYNPTRDVWETLWYNGDTQFNGVPIISTTSGMAYSSGVSTGRNIELSGLILSGEKAGLTGYRASVGSGGKLLDRGVNTVILPGRRLVYSVDDGLVVAGQSQ